MPIENVNVLKVTMKFYEGYKYKNPSSSRRYRLRKKRFLTQFRNDSVLLPVPFLEPGQFPYPTTLGGPVPAVVANALIKQTEDTIDVLWGLHHQWDCLVQGVEKAEKEWEHISNWVGDLIDIKDEIHQMEQELKQLKAEKERLKASGLGQRWGHAIPMAPYSCVSGHLLPKGAFEAEAKGIHQEKGLV